MTDSTKIKSEINSDLLLEVKNAIKNAGLKCDAFVLAVVILDGDSIEVDIGSGSKKDLKKYINGVGQSIGNLWYSGVFCSDCGGVLTEKIIEIANDSVIQGTTH